MKYREPQSNFFGKRGITWHITVVSRAVKKRIDSDNAFEDAKIQSDDDFSDDADKLDQTLLNDEEEQNDIDDVSPISIDMNVILT